MEKIPCIKCTSGMWEYIRPFLKNWEYEIQAIESFDNYPLLVINRGGTLGICTNLVIKDAKCRDRELVTDVEEFLERAAELKGFTYKRKSMKKFTKADLKSGMVVENAQKRKALVINDILIFNTSFDPLKNYKEDLTSRTVPELDIIKVYKQSDFWGAGLSGGIQYEELLWKREEPLEVTMQEIADKFGVSVEQLRIKE